MAERNVRFMPKKTAVPGRVPTGTTGDEQSFIKQGEIALNTADRKLWSYDGSTIFEIGSNSYLGLTGGTINGNFIVTGNTELQAISAASINAGTLLSGSTNLYDIFSSGNNYYTTGVTLNNKVLYFHRNDLLSAYTVSLNNLNPLSGGTLIEILTGDTTTVRSTLSDITEEPTGFKTRTTSTLSFDDSTRILSIQPTGITFNYYVKGKKYISSGATYQILDETGLHRIYFDDDGSFTGRTPSQGFDLELIYNKAYVAELYWNAETQEAVHIGDERHGLKMDGATHAYLHLTRGTVWENGLSLGNFDIDGNGDNNSAAQFSVSNGNIFDEDIKHNITDGLPQDLTPILNVPVWYMSGATGIWYKTKETPFAVVSGGTFGFTVLPYNKYSGGNWSVDAVNSGGSTGYTLGTYTLSSLANAEADFNFTDPVGTGLQTNNTARRFCWNDGSTTSSGVGPDGGVDGNPEGYVYTEASNPGAAGDVFTMELDHDLNCEGLDVDVSFYTNQRGDDNNATCELQYSESGGTWTTISTYGGANDPTKVPTNGTSTWALRNNTIPSNSSSVRLRWVITFPASGSIWNNDYGLDSVTVNAVASKKFVLAHLFGTNDIKYPVYSIMGQNDYTSLDLAREGANNELTNLIINGLPTVEFIPFATIIFQTDASYNNDVKARIISTESGENYVNWLDSNLSPTSTSGSHSNLADLGNDDHKQYALLDGRNGDILKIDNIESSSGNKVIIDDNLKVNGDIYSGNTNLYDIFTDTYTTGTTVNGSTIYFNRNDSLSAYTVDLSGMNGKSISKMFEGIFTQTSESFKITTSYKDIPFDTIKIKDDYYSHSATTASIGSEITILNDGWYEINAVVGAKTDSTSGGVRGNPIMNFWIDFGSGWEMQLDYIGGYIRENNSDLSCALVGTGLFEFSAGTKIKITIIDSVSNPPDESVVPYATRMSIKYIDRTGTLTGTTIENLKDIGDINANAPNDGDEIRFNGTTSKWDSGIFTEGKTYFIGIDGGNDLGSAGTAYFSNTGMSFFSFPDASDTTCSFNFKVPDDYISGGTFVIMYTTSNTNNNLRYDMNITSIDVDGDLSTVTDSGISNTLAGSSPSWELKKSNTYSPVTATFNKDKNVSIRLERDTSWAEDTYAGTGYVWGINFNYIGKK